MMDTQQQSLLSSCRGEFRAEDYIQPHYKEAYRLAIDHLLSGGRAGYQKFLNGERVGSFLSEEELLFITANAGKPLNHHTEEKEEEQEEVTNGALDKSSTGTYWPLHSDVEIPDLDLGWPKVLHERLQTNIDLLFHPPRQNNPSIKEVVRRHIQDARQVIAIVMDVFTDVDIFKEMMDASARGVPVYLLLDHCKMKRFLTMAENQDIKIQQLKNMRVRTVKGQDYLCRSGARFQGAMEQKFLLVDCKTALYGSYSFTWSFEKINLSMVQVITGHLVQSYDEEFRTLYAQSSVPAELGPPKDLLHDIRPNGRPNIPEYASNQSSRFERKDHLRHTLDAVYRKTCEKPMGLRDLYEDPGEHRPPMYQGMGVHNPMPKIHPVEQTNYPKRHSYAGERQDALYIPQNMGHRASNWNISEDAGFHNGRTRYPSALDYSQEPRMYRGQNMRQSHFGNDTHTQQHMPMLENTSKSFMRTWRIESYLQNPDASFGESCDFLDQYEIADAKPSTVMHSRMRSSLVFRSMIPEQLETNCYVNNSSTDLSAVAPNTAMHYLSMQWHPTEAEERARKYEEIVLKRQSLQILDDTGDNMSYIQGIIPHHSIYVNLGRPKGGIMNNIDISTDNWHKRHSVADPRSNTDYQKGQEPCSPMYGGAFAGRGLDRGMAGVRAQKGRYRSNLNEGQRSVSHYNVKNFTERRSPPPLTVWHEPPSRTVSAAALDGNGKQPTYKTTGIASPHFLKRSSKKICSLLNISEKKEASPRNLDVRSTKSNGSTSTIVAEDDKCCSNRNADRNPALQNFDRSSFDEQRNSTADADGSYRKLLPLKYKAEEFHCRRSPAATLLRTEQQSSLKDRGIWTAQETESWPRDQDAENHPFSRFEANRVCGSAQTQGKNQEKAKSSLLTKGSTSTELDQSHHENKLGKFIQRMANLIHKNK